jgi:hypothetical protein
MRLEELKSLSERNLAPLMEVHSVDPNIYLIFYKDGESLKPIVDKKNKTLRCKSRTDAFSKLREYGIVQTYFVHRTAYTEMIGSPSSDHQNELREIIQL